MYSILQRSCLIDVCSYPIVEASPVHTLLREPKSNPSLRPTETFPTEDLRRFRCEHDDNKCTRSYRRVELHHLPCRKAQSTFDPVCSRGCPATISRNRCNAACRLSIRSSENRFVKTCFSEVAGQYSCQRTMVGETEPMLANHLARKSRYVDPRAFPF
jgi:hypothetical protein